jgi:hypothetical protein
VAPRRGAGPGQRPPLFAQSLLQKAGLLRWQQGPAPGGRHRPGDPDEPRQKYTLDDPG